MFLCTGNYYRSRFAEAWFNHHAPAQGLAGWSAFSRGLELWDGNVGPISTHTRQRLAARDLPPADESVHPLDLTEADLREASLIVAVKEAEHRPRVQRRFPAWVDRVTYWGVHDLDASGPDAALDELEAHVDALIRQLRHA